MSRQTDHTPTASEDLATRLAGVKRQVIDLARRLAGGDGAVFRTLKHARHTLKLLEQQSRERDKRARRSTLTVELV